MSRTVASPAPLPPSWLPVVGAVLGAAVGGVALGVVRVAGFAEVLAAALVGVPALAGLLAMAWLRSWLDEPPAPVQPVPEDDMGLDPLAELPPVPGELHGEPSRH